MQHRFLDNPLPPSLHTPLLHIQKYGTKKEDAFAQYPTTRSACEYGWKNWKICHIRHETHSDDAIIEDGSKRHNKLVAHISKTQKVVGRSYFPVANPSLDEYIP